MFNTTDRTPAVRTLINKYAGSKITISAMILQW